MSPNDAGLAAQLAWRTASFCAARECVEVAGQEGAVFLRDSTQPGGTVLRCTATEWRSLIAVIKNGSFDGRRP
jgi:hypothetical protein